MPGNSRSVAHAAHQIRTGTSMISSPAAATAVPSPANLKEYRSAPSCTVESRPMRSVTAITRPPPERPRRRSTSSMTFMAIESSCMALKA